MSNYSQSFAVEGFESVVPGPIAGSLPPPPPGPRRILVVDDELLRREGIVQLLRDEGYVVASLAQPSSALEFVRKASPDLILMSTALQGGVASLELCRQLRRIDAARLTPIVLFAGSPRDEEHAERAFRYGADDYVMSPSRQWELKARVRVQLRNRRDRELLQWARAQRSSFKDEALTDSLTGIKNRRAFERALAEAIDAREPMMVMLIDLDHFKKVNDVHGHAAGDAALRQVGRTLDAITRQSDFAARFGGEEFVVLLRRADGARAFDIGERYRRALSGLAIPGFPLKVSASIGVTVWDGEGAPPSASELLSRADTALYEAKRAGRDRVSVTPAVAA